MGKRIFITNVSGNPVEITNKKVILYGTGDVFFKLINEIRFSNVAYIVDSDPLKEGMHMSFYGKDYTVSSPSVLLAQDYSDTCVIIASSKYSNEIYQHISKVIPDSSICTDRKKIECHYDTLQELLSDNLQTKEALIRSGWDRDPAAMERLFSETYKCVHSDHRPDYFFNIQSGFINLIFGYQVDQTRYVFRLPPEPGQGNKSFMPFYESGKKIRYEFHKRTKIGNELTMYENADGIRIDRYAEPFHYLKLDLKETKENVLKMLRELHSSAEKIDLSADFPSVHYHFFSDLFGKSMPEQKSVKKDIDQRAEDILHKYAQFPIPRCLCHGDCNYTNLVRYKGQLMYVDWDTMAMGDPFFDVCEFLYCIGMRPYCLGQQSYENAAEQIYRQLEQDLNIYLKRGCLETEYRRAYMIIEVMELACLMRDWIAADNVSCSQCQSILSRKPEC